LRILRIIEPGLSPQLTGDFAGIDPGRRPPGSLVAGAMDRAVMGAAERNGEFVAHFAAERPWLQVAEMMRIGLFAAADETRLSGNIAKVLAVSITPRCRKPLTTPPPPKKHLILPSPVLLLVMPRLRAGNGAWLENVAELVSHSSRNVNNMTPAIAMTASNLRARLGVRCSL
jgi:hypothetical protein